jgi:hypothetical protein
MNQKKFFFELSKAEFKELLKIVFWRFLAILLLIGFVFLFSNVEISIWKINTKPLIHVFVGLFSLYFWRKPFHKNELWKYFLGAIPIILLLVLKNIIFFNIWTMGLLYVSMAGSFIMVIIFFKEDAIEDTIEDAT